MKIGYVSAILSELRFEELIDHSGEVAMRAFQILTILHYTSLPNLHKKYQTNNYMIK